MKLTLTQIRINENLSIEQVAFDLDIPLAVMVEYESKPKEIPLHMAVELCAYYQVKMNKIKWLL